MISFLSGLIRAGTTVAALAAVAPAWSQQPADPYRQALLVGVWDYSHTAKLADMSTDLRELKRTLQSAGFDSVKTLPNASWSEFEIALYEAVAAAQKHRDERGVLTVIYFSGHGLMVDDASYLLTRDYVKPLVASNLVLSAALRVDYVAGRFAPVGEPVVMIVGTCRNAFTPGGATDPVIPGPVPPDTERFPRMIGLPSPYFGTATWYAQRPGLLMQVADPDPAVPTPFVQAIVDSMSGKLELGLLAASVERRVRTATENQTHPLFPYVDSAGAAIMLAYREHDRQADEYEWEIVRDVGREDLVQDFMARFLTSRYRAIARNWLDARHLARQLESATTYVTYTYGMRGTLGAGMFENIAGTLDNLVPKSVDPYKQVLTEDGRHIVPAEVRVMRRLPDDGIAFEAALQDSEIVRIEGPQSTIDPTRLVEFWNDPTATGTSCSGKAIADGACRDIEAVADFLETSDVKTAGTLFIAGVAGGGDDDFDPVQSHRRLVAIAARFAARGIDERAFAFRSFNRSELPRISAPVLIKRGDGYPIALNQQEASP